jgi:hypothetical protein
MSPPRTLICCNVCFHPAISQSIRALHVHFNINQGLMQMPRRNTSH